MDIAKIDKNFKIETEIKEDDIRFIDARKEPFKIYGVYYDSGYFRRMPEEVAKSVSEGVYGLHFQSAGGRLRFKTDSPYVALHSVMSYVGKMSHFALVGSAGFDLYVFDENLGEDRYFGSFKPPFDIENGFDGEVKFGSSKMREITINFPLYSTVQELYIGLSDTATVLPPKDYRIEKPVVYYGSSITQGGCASRPGMSYESIVSRKLGCNYINLGFSGNAKGEDEMRDYIKGLDMSAFVLDYEYNAPSEEHLMNTHERFFKAVRESHPDIPILIMSCPDYGVQLETSRRFAIIKRTYDNAVNSGDKNVYLLSGRELMEMAGYEGTVDGCHPTDLGFASMAKAVASVLEKVL